MMFRKNIIGFVLTGVLVLPGVLCGMEKKVGMTRKRSKSVIVHSSKRQKDLNKIVNTVDDKKHKPYFARSYGSVIASVGLCAGMCYAFYWVNHGDLQKTLLPIFKITVPLSFLAMCWFCAGKPITENVLHRFEVLYKREKLTFNAVCDQKIEQLKRLGENLYKNIYKKGTLLCEHGKKVLNGFVKNEQDFGKKMLDGLEEKGNNIAIKLTSIISTSKAKKMEQQCEDKREQKKIEESFNEGCNKNGFDPLKVSQFSVIKTNQPPSDLIQPNYMDEKSKNNKES
jgi:hypothetical protein